MIDSLSMAVHVFVSFVSMSTRLSENFVDNILDKPEVSCLHTIKWFQYFNLGIQLKSVKYCYLARIILSNITQSLALNYIIPIIAVISLHMVKLSNSSIFNNSI